MKYAESFPKIWATKFSPTRISAVT